MDLLLRLYNIPAANEEVISNKMAELKFFGRPA